MSVEEVFPLILFGISVMFTTLLFLIKNKKQNLNEIRKTIREDSEKAIKSLAQKVVETEEQVTLKQVEAQETCALVGKKIQELMDDGEELNQLGDALNKYRSMLAQLNIATSQAQAYVVRTNNDANKLQDLQHLIDIHEKKTYEILQTYNNRIEEQTFQFDAIKTEIESQTENVITQIVTTRDNSLSEVNSQIDKYKQLCDKCDEIQLNHKDILNELIENQLANKEKLAFYNKNFEDSCDNYLKKTISKLDEYLAQLKLSANDKLSLLEIDYVKDFEQELNNKKEATFLRIDDALSSSIKTISLYDEKLNKSYVSSENNKQFNNDIKNNSYNTVIKNVNLDKPVDESNKVKISDSLFENSLDDVIPTKKEDVTFKEAFKKENKQKKKKNQKNQRRKKDDNLDLMSGIDLVELTNEKINSDNKQFIDLDNSSIPDLNKTTLEDKVPQEIGGIKLDDLVTVDASFSDIVKKDKQIREELNNITSNLDSEKDDELESKGKNLNKALIDENNMDSILDKKNSDLNIHNESPITKLNGTGFEDLLNSYGSHKRKNDNEDIEKDSVKSFKPGSIIEMVVEESKQTTNENSDKSDSNETGTDISKSEKFSEKEEVLNNEDKNKSGFVVIGEEEEILLD